ncbi:DUF4907 domain-containing protein [Dyadobacter tibetensis]|uniref:DUF4907 domain-containing protein n=1 Tax=Dyadobacter tibetensis TaxID=1211851 RepID=UPI0004B61DB6|nr:DUF4907 domain-containing protein [Dyadobacter tibetensis]
MRKPFIILLVIAGLVGTYLWFNKASLFTGPDDSPEHVLHIKTSLDSLNGWGYEIFDDTTLIIQQKHLPGVEGLKGFEKESQARATGALVVHKIYTGQLPPTITRHELDSLLAL